MKQRIIYLCVEVSDSAKREVGAAGVVKVVNPGECWPWSVFALDRSPVLYPRLQERKQSLNKFTHPWRDCWPPKPFSRPALCLPLCSVLTLSTDKGHPH